jgi:hypothetical protein
VGGIPRADAAVVLAEGHVQNPVVGVLDGPVPAHGLQLEPGLGRQAGNEDADVGRDLVPAAAFGLDPDQAGQVAPRAVGVGMGQQGGAPVVPQRRISMRPWSLPTVSV